MIKLSKNTVKLLNLFYNHPDDSFYIQQIGRILKKKPGVFQRALYSMEKQGVLKSEFKANARFFTINKNYPIYNELKSIIHKKGLSLIVFLPFFILLAAGLGFSQEKSPEMLVVKSLKDAVSIAFKNNKDIRIQEQELKVSKANIMGARSAFLPKLDLNSGYQRNGAVPQVNLPGAKRDYGVFAGYKNDMTAGVSVTDNVYDGGASVTAFKQSKLLFTEQEQTLRATKLNVEFEAKRLYYGLLLAYETKRIAQDLVDQAQAHYEKTKQQFQQGTVSRFDVLQSKVQVSLLMPQLVSADNAIELIKAELNKLLGLNVLEDIIVEDKLSYEPIEIKEGEFLKQSYLNKPEMILQSIGVDVSKLGIRFAKSGWFPQVNASADYFYRSNSTGDFFNAKHNNWSAGISVSLPIFDGFATKAKVDAAKAKYTQSLLSKDNVQDQITVDVRSACLDMNKAQSIISSQGDNLEDAKEALRISEVRFDNGVGINLDVLDAQVSLAQVEQNIANGIYDYLLAQAQLERNMGIDVLGEGQYVKKE